MKIDPHGPLAGFDYDLPVERIAQSPAERRDGSRLLILERATGKRQHAKFGDILKHLRSGDLLVLNDTRVFPARLRASRRTGGRVEILLLESRPQNTWSALARPARTLRAGEDLTLESGGLSPGEEGSDTLVRFLGREQERALVELRRDGQALSREAVIELCQRVGETPLPPYIRRVSGEGQSPADRDRYQTVYAREVGSVAAPTAGLHFTEAILEQAAQNGVEIARVKLHVGLATFQPLTDQGFAQNELHEEEVEVGSEAAAAILKAREEGRRVVAVGTTSVRAIESFLAAHQAPTPPVLPYRGRTSLFIKPGHRFLGVDALITNFHLPRSSLLVLLAAFAGRELVLEAYREAVRAEYRFYSFGDAMLIV